jgi:hypothetical protein
MGWEEEGSRQTFWCFGYMNAVVVIEQLDFNAVVHHNAPFKSRHNFLR